MPSTEDAAASRGAGDRSPPTVLEPVMMGESFEDFKARLASAGLHEEMFNRRRGSLGMTKTLQDLHQEVQMNESQICIEGGKAVQYVELVKVYALAEVVGGDMCCLIEHDQFDTKDWRQRCLMQPLQKKMRTGESNWREAMHCAFQDLVGVDRTWQEAHLEVDEEGYRLHEERTASLEYPELPTVAKVHEIHVRIKQTEAPGDSSGSAAPKNVDEMLDDPLEQIGLPSGRDFVTREVCKMTREVRLHVWCWKSREYERNSRLLEFGDYLTSNGVDISKFGIGSAKSLFQFYVEVKEMQESYLRECPSITGPRLQRVVDLLKVKLIAEVHRRNRVLSSPEQFMDDGRKRKADASEGLPAIKLPPGGDQKKALEMMLNDRLGIEPAVQEAYLEEDKDKEEYSETAKASDGYPGLQTFYKIRTITLRIRDPQCEIFQRMGLPRGNDFVTREGSMGEKKGGKINVWTWLPLIQNSQAKDDESEDLNFTGTALEELCRNLFSAEDLIHQTREHPQVISAGMDKPLNTALQKIRWCSERSSNIDDTLKEVDVKAMMHVKDKCATSKGSSQEDTTLSRTSSAVTSRGDLSGLADFITVNFTRQGFGAADNLEADLTVPVEHTRSLPAAVDGFPESPLPQRMESSVIKHIADNMDNWGLDIFDLNERTNSRVIEMYGEVAFVQQCTGALACGREITRKFLETVQSLYYDNPYHNALHAVQVCHTGCWLTRNFNLVQHQSELERAAFTISTLCHDVKHFGVNNAFLINSEHSLALLYNNSKVLENMHAAKTFELLQSGGDASIAGKMSREDRAAMRSQIIEYILATDMSEHFEVISKFRVKIEAPEFSVENEADRRFVARLCMKSGDIGHASLPWDLHAGWSLRVQREFFMQGDEEKRLGLPVSALCDRAAVKDASSYANSQKGFLEFVCLPLFNVVCEHDRAKLESEDPASPTSSQLSQVIRTSSNLSQVTSEALMESMVGQTLVGTLKKNTTCWLKDEAVRVRVQKELLNTLSV